MIQLRVTEIANKLIGLFDRQSADLDGNGALKDWTQMQLEKYERRRDRIRQTRRRTRNTSMGFRSDFRPRTLGDESRWWRCVTSKDVHISPGAMAPILPPPTPRCDSVLSSSGLSLATSPSSSHRRPTCGAVAVDKGFTRGWKNFRSQGRIALQRFRYFLGPSRLLMKQ
jgi:hypothetical protein